MADYEFTDHARDMLAERKIESLWVAQTMEAPDKRQAMQDGIVHFIKKIEACGGRYLRVIVNAQSSPGKIITVFFDRRLRKQNET